MLQNASQIEEARRTLEKMGCDMSKSWGRKLYSTLHFLRHRILPEPMALNKSWDVLMMAQTVERYFPDRTTVIYDMGSYNSEIPLILWRRGYRNIIAADVNPSGKRINWYGNRIRFVREDFYESTVAAESIDVITATSTIEHGFREKEFLTTAYRLLRRGGLLLFSTDFRDPKEATDPKVRPFGMSYTIFSRAEIESLVQQAQHQGFTLLDDVEWKNSVYPVEWLGHSFTFVFVGLRKTA